MSIVLQRWSEINPILSAALDLTEPKRTTYLVKTCGEDLELRTAVERLIAEVESGEGDPLDDGALEGPLWDAFAVDLAGRSGSPVADSSSDGSLPTPDPEIGRYRLIEEIGRGGMSVVYRAERTDGAFEQRVALKLATLGLDPSARARFERERQILANLRHPHIAQILDGGEAPDGRPYLVMELVEGEPIDSYCDRHRLNVADRLILFAQVGSAVEHAHHNLVVHRDLKPSNVLVDGNGQVKLLDFGIAAFVEDPTVPEAPGLTRTHFRPMTPEYASPEQVRGSTITTAADVYQLGNLLYRLLTGCPPYRLERAKPDTWRQIIAEAQAPDPREVVTKADVRRRLLDAPPDAKTIAASRGTSPSRLARSLHGDLSTIVLMALRKEPERRYGSVQGLLDDLDRLGRREPVAAQPNSLGYRARKFMARNRVAVAVTTVVVTLLIAFVAILAVQATRLARERDRARREAETAERVTQFLVDIFYDAAPPAGSTIDVRAIDVVDRGAERIEDELRDDPIVRARVLSAIGSLYSGFGQQDRAQTFLEEAIEIFDQEDETDPLERAEALEQLCDARIGKGLGPREVDQLGEVVDIYRATYGDVHASTINALFKLATAKLWTGDFAGSRVLYDRALFSFAGLPADSSQDRAVLALQFGVILETRRETDRALAMYQEAYAIASALDRKPILSSVALYLAGIYSSHDDLELQERYARESLTIGREVYGDDSPILAPAYASLGQVVHANGEYAESERLFRRCVALSAASETTPPGVLQVHQLRLAELLLDADRPGEAGEILDDARPVLESLYGTQTVLTNRGRSLSGRVQLDEGDIDGAGLILRDALKILEAQAAGARGHGEALEMMGRVWLAQEEADSARVCLEKGTPILMDALPADHWKLARSRVVFARSLAALGETEQARVELDAALAVLDRRGDRYEREALETMMALGLRTNDTPLVAASRKRLDELR